MLPEWLGPVLEQTPWGIVIIILAWMNKSYQETRDKLFSDALHQTVDALRENSAVLGEVRSAVSRLNGRGT